MVAYHFWSFGETELIFANALILDDGVAMEMSTDLVKVDQSVAKEKVLFG